MNTLLLTNDFLTDETEIDTELRQRELIRRLCRETLELSARRAEESMMIPDEELEEGPEDLYALLKSDLAVMLKPEYLGILAEEHDAAYRSRAGRRLRELLAWGETPCDGISTLRVECA